MEKCVNCGSSTSLYVEGRLLCPKCDGFSSEEQEKRREERISDEQGPSIRQLELRSVDEILRIGGHRSGGPVGDIGNDFGQVRALYRFARLNSTK
jgi:hypothetical protein